jgi:hypothetical protein
MRFRWTEITTWRVLLQVTWNRVVWCIEYRLRENLVIRLWHRNWRHRVLERSSGAFVGSSPVWGIDAFANLKRLRSHRVMTLPLHVDAGDGLHMSGCLRMCAVNNRRTRDWPWSHQIHVSWDQLVNCSPLLFHRQSLSLSLSTVCLYVIVLWGRKSNQQQEGPQPSLSPVLVFRTRGTR